MGKPRGIVAVVLLSLGLSACGGGDPAIPEQPSTSSPAPSSDSEITEIGTVSATQALNAVGASGSECWEWVDVNVAARALGPRCFDGSRGGHVAEGQGIPAVDLNEVEATIEGSTSDTMRLGSTTQGLPYVHWLQEIYSCTNHCDYYDVHVGVIQADAAVTSTETLYVQYWWTTKNMTESEFLSLLEAAEITP